MSRHQPVVTPRSRRPEFFWSGQVLPTSSPLPSSLPGRLRKKAQTGQEACPTLVSGGGTGAHHGTGRRRGSGQGVGSIRAWQHCGSQRFETARGRIA